MRLSQTVKPASLDLDMEKYSSYTDSGKDLMFRNVSSLHKYSSHSSRCSSGSISLAYVLAKSHSEVKAEKCPQRETALVSI